mmetsp:Transcript_11497/g.17402  ORF Transcript_11497/g.17402 Transcript_11497/m.17402 type:complete len:217 (+) Transcript_11497:466-1116(+)
MLDVFTCEGFQIPMAKKASVSLLSVSAGLGPIYSSLTRSGDSAEISWSVSIASCVAVSSFSRWAFESLLLGADTIVISPLITSHELFAPNLGEQTAVSFTVSTGRGESSIITPSCSVIRELSILSVRSSFSCSLDMHDNAILPTRRIPSSTRGMIGETVSPLYSTEYWNVADVVIVDDGSTLSKWIHFVEFSFKTFPSSVGGRLSSITKSFGYKLG